MFLLPANALAVLTPSVGSEFSPDRLRIRLDEAALREIEALTTLKHARYASLATALGEIALRRLEPYSLGAAKAVVTIGDGLHLDVTRAFRNRMRSSGGHLVNPIMFPNTLPSACAVTIGALYGAHVCAVAVDGHDPMRRALHLSRLLLEAGTADEVLLLAFDLQMKTEALALGYLISLSPLGHPSLEVTWPDDPASVVGGGKDDVPAAWLAEFVAVETSNIARESGGLPPGRNVGPAGLKVRLHKPDALAQS